jgi:DNA-binding MarR family transcriptional regulator
MRTEPRPQRLADDELDSVAQNLAALAERLKRGAFDEAASEHRPASALERAERLYRARRLRGKYFKSELFGEPAWDLLLDLFIHGERGKTVSISSACLGAAVPATTALRWIDCLVTEGLLMRVTDASDKRRIFVQLTPCGREAMLAFCGDEL